MGRLAPQGQRLLKTQLIVWDGAFVYQNGPNYRNGPPEWTLICGFEYFLSTLLGQSGLELPQKVIKPKNMQFMYRKMDSAQWGTWQLTHMLLPGLLLQCQALYR